jgi:hypothetical protein
MTMFESLEVGSSNLSATPLMGSVTTAATPASGSCGVQFVFYDKDGVQITEPLSGLLYLSTDATGLTQDLAGTSIAVLTNGALTNLIAK